MQPNETNENNPEPAGTVITPTPPNSSPSFTQSPAAPPVSPAASQSDPQTSPDTTDLNAAINAAIPPTQPASPTGRSKVKLLLATVGVLLVLGGGAAAAYFGVIVPSKPENVLKAALNNSLQETQASFKGNYTWDSVEEGGLAFKINFKGASDAKAKDATTQFDFTVSGVTISLEARYADQNLYVKAGDLAPLVGTLGAFDPEAAAVLQKTSQKISNQWIVFDSTLLKQAGASCVLDADLALSKADIKLLNDQYDKHPFTTIKSTATDTLDGKKATKFVLDIDDDKGAAYLAGLDSLSLNRSIKKCDKSGNLDEPGSSSLADHDHTLITVWVDKSTKHIVQISSHSNDKDAKKSGVKGSLTLTFKYEKVSVSKPAGAKPALQVLNELGLGDLLGQLSTSNPSSSVSGGIQDKAQDSKRQTDLSSIQTQLEAYFSEHGYYPSLADMNSDSWLKTNMKSLDKNALIDPSNVTQSSKLVAAPAAKSYAYAVTDSSGDSCERNDTNCAKYALTATLSDGKTYSKSNLD